MERFSREALALISEPLNDSDKYFPAGGLPKDSVLVVRTADPAQAALPTWRVVLPALPLAKKTGGRDGRIPTHQLP